MTLPQMPSRVLPRLAGRIGSADVRAMAYADYFLRHANGRWPIPELPFWRQPVSPRGYSRISDPALWLPLALAPSSVQHTKNTTNGSPLTTANFGSSCTTGNRIILAIHYSHFDDPPPTPTDTLSTTYAQIASVSTNGSGGASGGILALYTGVLTSSGTNAVSCNVFFASNASIYAIEVQGTVSGAADTSATGTSASTGTTATTGAFSTVAAQDYVFFGATFDSNFDLSTAKVNGSATGVTLLDGAITTPSQGEMGVAEHIPAGILSSTTASMDTVGSANPWGIILAAFQAASVTVDTSFLSQSVLVRAIQKNVVY